VALEPAAFFQPSEMLVESLAAMVTAVTGPSDLAGAADAFTAMLNTTATAVAAAMTTDLRTIITE
jgi:hypothetical protein